MAVTPNYYETLYITRPDIQEEDLAKIQQKLQDSISAHQGEIIKADKWAERGLAYEIQDHKRGIYYILVFKALPSACAEIEKHLSFYNTDILRFITIKTTEEAVNKEKAAQEKAAEEAANKERAAQEKAAEEAANKERAAQEKAAEKAEAEKAESAKEPAVEFTAEVEVIEETPEADKEEPAVEFTAEVEVAEKAPEADKEEPETPQQAESAEEEASEVTEEEGETK